MVNKVALGILAVIILTAMTVGGLVGLQLGGGGTLGGDGTPTGTTTPAASASPGGSETTQPSAASATATPTATPVPTVAPSEFNESEIELAVQARLNERRETKNRKALRMFDRLREMARFHSENMAQQGFPAHSADGFTTAERYEKYELEDRCKIPDDSETGLREDEALETVAKTVAGRPYNDTVTGEPRTNLNESEVADAVLDKWFDRENERRKLLLEKADEVGVGATVQEDGDVYVTVDLC